jgi:hypothetical protein
MATRDTVILRRSMVIDNTRGRIRVCDFCVVWTSLGIMLEPSDIVPKIRANRADFQCDDPLSLVDDIVFIDQREKYALQNPVHYGDPLNWSCLHDLQLFQGTFQQYPQYGKHFQGPAGA